MTNRLTVAVGPVSQPSHAGRPAIHCPIHARPRVPSNAPEPRLRGRFSKREDESTSRRPARAGERVEGRVRRARVDARPAVERVAARGRRGEHAPQPGLGVLRVAQLARPALADVAALPVRGTSATSRSKR